MGVLHPDAVLHQEGGLSAMPPPACEHYAGDEKKLRKALALQDEMQGAFDVTADMEDGAPSGAEAETAALLSRILAEPRAETRRVGARVHPVDHPAFRNDVSTLIAAKPAGLAYITVPKIAGLSQFQEAIEWIEAQTQKAGLRNPIPLQIMFEDEAGLHDVFEIAFHVGLTRVDHALHGVGQLSACRIGQGGHPIGAALGGIGDEAGEVEFFDAVVEAEVQLGH